PLIPSLVLAAFALTSCGTATSAADDEGAPQLVTDASSVSVEDPWVRATSGTEDASMTAAFMGIDNAAQEEVTIVAASSSVTEMVELHEMAMVDGASVMQEIEGGIVLAPERGKLLQPGGM